VWTGVLKTVGAIVVSPAVGFALALVFVLIVSWIFVAKTPYSVDPPVPAAPIRLRGALFTGPRQQRCAKDHGHHCRTAVRAGHLGSEFYVPFWVVLSCQAAMALGTLFGGVAHCEDNGL
jgi:PiT family inorganic phosphate transporter